jgi:hypothetical protein
VSPQPPFDIVQDWQATLPNRSRAVWTFPRPLRTD